MNVEILYEDHFVNVEFDYFAGRPAKLWGPPENCYPEDPEEIEITSLDGLGRSVSDLTDGEYEHICDLIKEKLNESDREPDPLD